LQPSPTPRVRYNDGGGPRTTSPTAARAGPLRRAGSPRFASFEDPFPILNTLNGDRAMDRKPVKPVKTPEPTSPQTSRREFMKYSTAAAVGAALAASAVPKGVYAAGNDTIKIGLVGCGGRGSGA